MGIRRISSEGNEYLSVNDISLGMFFFGFIVFQFDLTLLK